MRVHAPAKTEQKKTRIGAYEKTVGIDHTTGQKFATVEKTDEYVVETEPEFMKCYIQDIGKLCNVKPAALRLLIRLIQSITMDEYIVLNPGVKAIMAKDLKTSVGMINQSLHELTTQDFLVPEGRGLYVLNPGLFAKGKWGSIKKRRDQYIELRIKYEDGKRVMSADVLERPCGDPDLDQIDMMTGKTKREMLAETA